MWYLIVSISDLCRLTCLTDFYHLNTKLLVLNMLEFGVHYCKFGNFRENFIFGKSVQRHNCHVIISRQGHYLPTSVNDRVISPFREGFIFMKLFRGCEVL